MRDVLDVLQRAQLVVFDFDGTLVDSNPIKHRAFAECFMEFPEQLDDILEYCWGHHHVPRGEKFRYVYETILQRAYTSAVAAALHERFDVATTRQIIAAPEIPGATDVLRAVSQRYTTALLSSTPQEMLVYIVEQRGWSGYFKRIQGAPVDKKAWLRTAQTIQALEGTQVVFFGDTQEDETAAIAAGCRFIRVGGSANGAMAAQGIWSMSDFTSLLPLFSEPMPSER